ncbi:MAG: methionyl-tRNA formyltransferase [Firmicutes bacterium]|nr:methionyl-tRNA formyltransferase [Bacillota bacterium]
MDIIYMGTPDFAVPALEKLIDSKHNVRMVITKPDAERDRGKKVQATPVKETAVAHGIPVMQPVKLRTDEETKNRIREIDPDLIVVAAYGQILPRDVLDAPKKGCVNIHGSLLPKHRGAAPIQQAILDGDEETGVTIMYMEEGLDTGDMLAKRATPIGKKTAGDLHDELAVMGAELLMETLDSIESGTITPEKQDDALASYAPMISKKDGKLDFSMDPVKIERQIRAMSPWPGAFADMNGSQIKIWEAEVLPSERTEPAGTIVGVSDEGLEISAGGRSLLAKTIQVPGKKRMAVADYLRGHTVETGTVLR